MDLGLVHMPLYTGITAALLAIMQVVLMFRVIAMRGEKEVLIGTGGVDTLEQRIRVHGNLVENAPTFLVVLALVELISGSTYWVLGFAAAFVVGRLAHAVGLSMTVNVSPGRLVGTLLSMITMVVASGYLIYLVIGKL